MPSTSGVHSTPSQYDTGSGSRRVRVIHTLIAVLLAGGLMYVAPGTATARSDSATTTAALPGGTSGSANGAPRLVTAAADPAHATMASDAYPIRAAAPAVAAQAAGTVVPAAAAPVAPADPAAPPPVTAASSAAATYTVDLYDSRAERWQNPDKKACTAASTLSMLNTISYAGAPAGFVWKPTTAFATQEAIFGFERAHMTMTTLSAGTDPHGWRNALNYYGWGSIKAGVYVDESFTTFDAAAKRAVSALATTRKPVGILARLGGHAQFITGYTVTGADPATGSTDFTVVGVYLTDPWQAAGHRDTYVTYAQWQTGGKWFRFSQYVKTDSPYKDRIDGHVGVTEWYGKWVIIAPVK